MSSKLKIIGKYVIGWPLSVLALIFIFSKILPDSQNISQRLSDINIGSLIVGMICFLFYFFLRSLLWRQILSSLGRHLSLRQTAFSWSISELNRYIPGNVWSFVSRTYLFSLKSIERKDIVKALFIEGQLILLGALIVSLFSIPFLVQNLSIRLFDGRFALFFPLFAVVVLASFFIFQTKLYQHVHSRLQKIYEKIFNGFSESQNFSLLLTSVLSFLFFGLGYFFSISAVVSLSPKLIFGLSGFFVVALLLGYLSFVTPTGLGVREGVITYGLASIVGVGVAGFAAIFARIVLILSEVIFITLAYVYARIQTNTMRIIEHAVIRNPYEAVLAVAMGSYIVFFTWLSFLRHDNFYTGRFDLGNMVQTVWNTMNGRFFEFTNPNGTEIVSRLAFHADFLLVFLTPFYALWPNPKMLLLLQTVFIAFGAFFVFKIAEKEIRSKSIALVLSIVFLINPSVQRVNLYDFHAVAFATTFLLGSWYLLREKRTRLFIFFLFLAGISKEQVWLITGLIGIFAWIKYGYKKLGITVAVVSFLLFYILIWQAIPASSGSEHFALEYYSEFGNSPSSVASGLFLRSDLVISQILTRKKIDYLKQLVLPLGYLSLLSPHLLVFAVPDLLINLLSKNPQLQQIYYQYTATITPFLFIAAIQTIKQIKKHNPLIPNKLIGFFLFLVAFYSAYSFGPMPFSKEPNTDMITLQLNNNKFIERYLDTIPDVYSVASTNNVGSHIAHRRYIYTLPLGLDTADYIILLHTRHTKTGFQEFLDYKTYLSNSENHILLLEQDDFIVFKKRAILTRGGL